MNKQFPLFWEKIKFASLRRFRSASKVSLRDYSYHHHHHHNPQVDLPSASLMLPRNGEIIDEVLYRN